MTVKIVLPPGYSDKHVATKVPVKIWTDDIGPETIKQLTNLASMPFVHKNGVACMPDVHKGIGSTVGSVIATSKVIIPAAVGVDIGCGMNAVRTSLTANDLPDNLFGIRDAIEKRIPLSATEGVDANSLAPISFARVDEKLGNIEPQEVDHHKPMLYSDE